MSVMFKKSILAQPLSAIILAAGIGSRLVPLTNETPKCLVSINNIPILHNMLTALKFIGVYNIVIVIGYLGQKIQDYVDANFPELSINFVNNLKYCETGSAYSLILGLNIFPTEHSLILLEADVMFDQFLIEKLIKLGSYHDMATLLEPYSPHFSGTFALINYSGVLTNWVHESVRKPDFPLYQSYKTVNLSWFSMDSIATLNKSLKNTLSHFSVSAPLEYVMSDIIRSGGRIQGITTEGSKWFEVDTIEDLEIANNIFNFRSN